jgi:two-component system, OmpR family, sensor kinase
MALLELLRAARTRILGWVLLLAALGMLFAGATVYLVERARIESRIDRSLTQEVDEFRTFAREGIDPRTGRRFESVERLFFVALQRNVPDRNEALFGFIDGQVRYFSPGPDADTLRRNPDFRRVVAALTSTGQAEFGHVDTSAGTVRFAVLPVDPNAGKEAWVVAHWTDRAQAEFVEVVRTYAVVAAAGLLLVGVVGWFVAGRLLGPVRELRRTARQISESDLTRRIDVHGTDDISDLARTFNAMLDRLEAAFGAQRQFLDDAGHELRTPLTIVRGHLELLEHNEAGEFAETKALVVDELDRMGRLVEDLLTLAKAERPDFVRPAPVDMGMLVDDVFDKATALGNRRWRIDARADLVLVADAQRLTQALLQLAHNAVKHTNPADTIAIGSSIDHGTRTVRLWVRDTGPGVPPEDAERIFGRFQRGAAHPRIEGSGLGLAIVTAIAEAHNGRVELASRPGHGATFSLVVPY